MLRRTNNPGNENLTPRWGLHTTVLNPSTVCQLPENGTSSCVFLRFRLLLYLDSRSASATYFPETMTPRLIVVAGSAFYGWREEFWPYMFPRGGTLNFAEKHVYTIKSPMDRLCRDIALRNRNGRGAL